MNKKSFPWLVCAITGCGIGFPVTLLCMTLLGGFNEVIAQFLTWMVASALFGLITGLLSYKCSRSLPAATAIHCVWCLIIAAAACTICGYGDNFLTVLIHIVPVFVIVYALIYAFCFLAMTREAKKINQMLNKE